MPKLDSTRYTFLFATIVCVVCALLVAVSAVGLHEQQETNALLYRQKNVLLAAGLVKPDEDLSANGAPEDLRREHPRPAGRSCHRRARAGRASRTRRPTTSARRATIPAQSRAAPPNSAGVSRLPNYGTVYFVMKGDEVRLVVLPIEGVGMWGTLYGFLALERDGNTVRGLTYYDQKETPGLGGEISNPKWQARVERPQGLQRQLGAAARRHQGQGRPAGQGPAARRRPVRRDDHEQRRLAADGVLDVERRLGPLPHDTSAKE